MERLPESWGPASTNFFLRDYITFESTNEAEPTEFQLMDEGGGGAEDSANFSSTPSTNLSDDLGGSAPCRGEWLVPIATCRLAYSLKRRGAVYS